MAFPQKLDILASIIDHIVDDYPRLEGYKAVIGKLRQAQAARYRVAHARWLQESDGTVCALRLTARGQIKPAQERVTLDDLRRIGCQVQGAAIGLMELVVLSPKTIAERARAGRAAT